MISPSRIVLLTLCVILSELDLTSGFAIRKPQGSCPPYLRGVRCLSKFDAQCTSRSHCHWNEICCFNGCESVCMKVSGGFPHPHPTYVPEFGRFLPFPHNVYPQPDPIPDKPDLPPVLFPPMDPANFVPYDDHLPVFPGGGYDDFP